MNQNKLQPAETPSCLTEQLRSALDKLAQLQHDLSDLQEGLTNAFLVVQADPNSQSASQECDVEGSNTARLDETIDLEKWLRDRDIRIKQRRPENPFDESFDRLALFLGRHFDCLRDFYAALKKRVGGSPYPRSLSLQNLLPNQIGDVVKFGQDLHRNAFLKEFRYIKRQRLIAFHPQEDGRVTNFFTGGWLERYVMLTTYEHFKSRNSQAPVATLKNPRVILPSGEDFELDILLANGPTVLWFECKTGKNFPAYVSKYGSVAKDHMQIDSGNAALVLLEELSEEEKSNNAQFAGMSVLNLQDLDHFLSSLNGSVDDRDFSGPERETVQPSAYPEKKSEFAVLLRRSKLRPLDPTDRRKIIVDLLAEQSAATERIPLRDLVIQLKARYDADHVTISKTKINDISSALVRSGCCERGGHSDYENDVWFLREHLSPDEGFDACSQLYIWTWLKAVGPKEVNKNETTMLAQLLWGNDIQTNDAHSNVNAIIKELISAGQCTCQSIDDQRVVHAGRNRCSALSSSECP